MAFLATSPSATHVSCLTWCLALFYSGSGRVCVYSTFLLLCKHQVTGFPSDCFPSLTHAAMHRQPQPRQREKTDGGRKQLNSTSVGSRAHQGTRQQLMAPRTLAGKQGDFKVVAALCSLSSLRNTTASKWQFIPSRAARQGCERGQTSPSSCFGPLLSENLCTAISSRVGRHRAMHSGLWHCFHAVASEGSDLQRCNWAPKSPRSYSEILLSSPPMLVFFHSFDHSWLEFNKSHSSAKPDDEEIKLKGFVLSLSEPTYFPINKKQAERRLTPICNLQRSWRPSEQLRQRKSAITLVLMLYIITEMKKQSWRTLRRIRRQYPIRSH